MRIIDNQIKCAFTCAVALFNTAYAEFTMADDAEAPLWKEWAFTDATEFDGDKAVELYEWRERRFYYAEQAKLLYEAVDHLYNAYEALMGYDHDLYQMVKRVHETKPYLY